MRGVCSEASWVISFGMCGQGDLLKKDLMGNGEILRVSDFSVFRITG